MIYSLRGKVEFRGEKFAVINVAGVGYKVFCAPETIKKIVVGQEIQVFTHLHLKEDAIELYGFLTSDELELFETLNGISGIGPKTALLLSSLGPLEKLKNMMVDNTPNDVYYNCANMDCNALFLCCLDCLKAHKGCCCPQCEEAPRIRPYQENGKPFKKWGYQEKLAWKNAHIQS